MFVEIDFYQIKFVWILPKNNNFGVVSNVFCPMILYGSVEKEG